MCLFESRFAERFAITGSVLVFRKVISLAVVLLLPEVFPTRNRFSLTFPDIRKNRAVSAANGQGPQGRAAFSCEGAARVAWSLVPVIKFLPRFASYFLLLSSLSYFLLLTTWEKFDDGVAAGGRELMTVGEI